MNQGARLKALKQENQERAQTFLSIVNYGSGGAFEGGERNCVCEFICRGVNVEQGCHFGHRDRVLAEEGEVEVASLPSK